MTLTNYWWLLIWMFAAGGIIAWALPKQPVMVMGKREYRWTMSSAVIFVLPYIIWAGYRKNIGDTETYRKTFRESASSLSQLSQAVSDAAKDKGFTFLTVLIKSIVGNSDVIFFMLIAIVQMLCIVVVFRKYSTNFWFSMFLFVASTDYLSWMHNGMRQFLAVTIIFACTGLLLKKKYLPVILVILLVATIHGSALFMLPIIFLAQGKAWNKKTLLFIAGVILIIAGVDQFTQILQDMLTDTQYSDMTTNEIWTTDDGTSFIRVLVYSVPAVFAFLGIKYIEESGDPVVNLAANMSIVTAGLYVVSMFTSGIYIGRMPIYTSLYSYILLPWIFEHAFNERSKKLMYALACGCYLVFFYYQMHATWGIL